MQFSTRSSSSTQIAKRDVVPKEVQVDGDRGPANSSLILAEAETNNVVGSTSGSIVAIATRFT
jgi:hypothetical protein